MRKYSRSLSNKNEINIIKHYSVVIVVCLCLPHFVFVLAAADRRTYSQILG